MPSRRVLLWGVLVLAVLLLVALGRWWTRRSVEERFNQPAHVNYEKSEGF